VKVGSVQDLVAKLKNESAALTRSGAQAMTTLLISDHDGTVISDGSKKALTAAAALGAPFTFSWRAQAAARRPTTRAGSPASGKVLYADDPRYDHMLPSRLRRSSCPSPGATTH
jgi:hypothetical protein